jgi:hypothetical protein
LLQNLDYTHHPINERNRLLESALMRDVDKIIQLVRGICPAVGVTQLHVSHPGADDDGLWYFDQPSSEFQVQIESLRGMCPFLVETDEIDDRLTGCSLEETVEILTRLLHIKE